jgi:hypothetical protein
MNFEAWLDVPRQDPLGEAERNKVMDICEALRDPMAPATMEPEDAFDALCMYCRGTFSYAAVGRGLTAALTSRQFNCAAAADLVVGVILNLSGKDLEVSRFSGVFGGQRPVVSPRIDRPGVTIENNLDGGGSRMLFSGGHWIAMVADDQFDLITGRRDHRIDFLQATRTPDVNGQPTFTCDVDGAARTFTKVDGTTAEGLSKFVVAPALA